MSRIRIAVCSCIMILVVFTSTFFISNTGFFSSARSTIGVISSSLNNFGRGLTYTIKTLGGWREYSYQCSLPVESGYRAASVHVFHVPNNDYMNILSYDNDVLSTEQYPISSAVYITVDPWKFEVTFYDVNYIELFTTFFISWSSLD